MTTQSSRKEANSIYTWMTLKISFRQNFLPYDVARTRMLSHWMLTVYAKTWDRNKPVTLTLMGPHPLPISTEKPYKSEKKAFKTQLLTYRQLTLQTSKNY